MADGGREQARLRNPSVTTVTLPVREVQCAYREPHGWHWSVTQGKAVEDSEVIQCPGVPLGEVHQVQDWMPDDLPEFEPDVDAALTEMERDR